MTETSTEVSGRLVSRGLNVYFEMDCSACQGCGMSGPDQSCSGCGGSGVEAYHLTRELPDDEANTRDKAIARLNAILREEHGKLQAFTMYERFYEPMSAAAFDFCEKFARDNWRDNDYVLVDEAAWDRIREAAKLAVNAIRLVQTISDPCDVTFDDFCATRFPTASAIPQPEWVDLDKRPSATILFSGDFGKVVGAVQKLWPLADIETSPGRIVIQQIGRYPEWPEVMAKIDVIAEHVDEITVDLFAWNGDFRYFAARISGGQNGWMAYQEQWESGSDER